MKKFCAFSLSEIIITIGVIGVVAALTIPTVATNYYKHNLEVHLAKTYQELKDAIKRSELENGSFRYWDYTMSSGAFARTYILPYLDNNFEGGAFFRGGKTQWSYPDGGCIGCFSHWPRFAYGTDDNKKIIAFNITLDRNACAESFPGTCTMPRLLEIAVDVDGRRKGPSMMGVDVHMFILTNYIKKTGWGGGTTGEYYGLHAGTQGSGYYATYKESDATALARCKGSSGYHVRGDCTILLHRNNWKFPKDYPIKF